MRLILACIWCFLALPFKDFAQQRPQYTQYIMNNFLLNPAISGIENYVDLKAGVRRQWTGIDGAPETLFFSVQGPLGDQFLWNNALTQPGNDGHPMQGNYQQNYDASAAHHGVGLVWLNDRIGIFSQNQINLTYAYHLKLNGQYNLSIGMGAGIVRQKVNQELVTFETVGDPTLGNNGFTGLKPDLNLGLWLYAKSFFFGLSAQQLLKGPQSQIADGSQANSRISHYFLTSGYKFWLSEDISVLPSIMIKHVNPVPMSIDLNAKFSFQDRFWLGGSFRKNDAFAGMLGFNVNSLINVSYSYDYTLSSLNAQSRGSHELMLGILLNNSYQPNCPKRLW